MDFKAGKLKKAYKYSYFLPEKINHGYIWTEQEIGQQTMLFTMPKLLRIGKQEKIVIM